MTDSKGMLHLCPEGKRLYDEYCQVYDDKSKTGDEMLIAWDAYYNHVMECESCGYF
jgi:hypothetical protein